MTIITSIELFQIRKVDHIMIKERFEIREDDDVQNSNWLVISLSSTFKFINLYCILKF